MLFVSFPSNSFCFKNCIKTDDSQLSYTLIISHDKINIVQFSAHFLLRKNIWQLQENTELFKEEKEKFKWTKKNVDRGQNREWGKTGAGSESECGMGEKHGWDRTWNEEWGKTRTGFLLKWGMGENLDWITAGIWNGGKPLEYGMGKTCTGFLLEYGMWENLDWIPAGIQNEEELDQASQVPEKWKIGSKHLSCGSSKILSLPFPVPCPAETSEVSVTGFPSDQSKGRAPAAGKGLVAASGRVRRDQDVSMIFKELK